MGKAKIHIHTFAKEIIINLQHKCGHCQETEDHYLHVHAIKKKEFIFCYTCTAHRKYFKYCYIVITSAQSALLQVTKSSFWKHWTYLGTVPIHPQYLAFIHA